MELSTKDISQIKWFKYQLQLLFQNQSSWFLSLAGRDWLDPYHLRHHRYIPFNKANLPADQGR